MPLAGFGTWKIPQELAEDMVYGAIKAGYRLLDCAAVYANQVQVGRGIKKALDEKICTREELWITSKLWNSFHLPEHVKPALQRTLNDLGLDYIDLYLVHWPAPVKYVDPAEQYPITFGHTYKAGEKAFVW